MSVNRGVFKPMRKASGNLLLSCAATLALAVIFVAGCADRKEVNEPMTHVEGWMDRSSDRFHGRKIEEANLISCSRCHGSDHRGGTAGVSCYNCHANGPSGHPAGWMDTTAAHFHGLAVAENGTDRCATCHGEDFRGIENNGSSCFLCHDGPSGHPSSGWLSKTSANFHGLDASARSLTVCAGCHGTDFEGGISGVSCGKCHENESGHPATGWLDSSATNFHGDRLAATSLAYCAGCHGQDFQGGDSEVSCFTCHDGPSGHPAATVWLNITNARFHGVSASQRGLPACAECHGTDFHGGVSNTSCFTCHNTGPSGHPATAEWMNSTSSRFHGVRLSQTGTAYCGGCHGTDFQGGFSGTSCFTCHDGPSGHPYGWLDSNAGANFHGQVLATEGITSCLPCHGPTLDGGISGVACSDCH